MAAAKGRHLSVTPFPYLLMGRLREIIHQQHQHRARPRMNVSVTVVVEKGLITLPRNSLQKHTGLRAGGRCGRPDAQAGELFDNRDQRKLWGAIGQRKDTRHLVSEVIPPSSYLQN